jgi:hypothetical protein
MQQVISEGEPVLTTNAQADPRFGDQKSISLMSRVLKQVIKIECHLLGILGVKAPRQEAQALPIEGTCQPDALVKNRHRRTLGLNGHAD